MKEYWLLIIGSFLGATLSILGGFINTKHGSKEAKRRQEETELIKIENASKRLITKLKTTRELIEPLVSTKDQMFSGNLNVPLEIRGMLPIIEHSIEPIDWINDLSMVSVELTDDDFKTLSVYFTTLKRCEDVMNRTWELRAAQVDFQVQLHSFWNLLDSCKNTDRELEVVNRLLDTIKHKKNKLYTEF